MSESSRLDRAIPVLWTAVTISLSCIVLLIVFPGLRAQILAIAALLLAVASFAVSNFFKDDLQRLIPSRKARRVHLTLLSVFMIISVAGVALLFARNPAYSGNIYGLNMWTESTFDHGLGVVIDPESQRPVENLPADSVSMDCPDESDEKCAPIEIIAELTNDSSRTVTAVRFVLSVSGQDYPMIFHSAAGCFSNPITIGPGHTIFAVLMVPEFPLKLVEAFKRQNQVPTVRLVDPTNNSFNVINREDNRDEVIKRQSTAYSDEVKRCFSSYPKTAGSQRARYDSALIGVARELGIVDKTGPEIVAESIAVCDTLKGNHGVVEDAVRQVQDWYPGLSRDFAGRFIGASMRVRCGELQGHLDFTPP